MSVQSAATESYQTVKSDMDMGRVNPWVGSQILKVEVGWVIGLGYIFIFCIENDGYNFYNCVNLSIVAVLSVKYLLYLLKS